MFIWIQYLQIILHFSSMYTTICFVCWWHRFSPTFTSFYTIPLKIFQKLVNVLPGLVTIHILDILLMKYGTRNSSKNTFRALDTSERSGCLTPVALWSTFIYCVHLSITPTATLYHQWRVVCWLSRHDNKSNSTTRVPYHSLTNSLSPLLSLPPSLLSIINSFSIA